MEAIPANKNIKMAPNQPGIPDNETNRERGDEFNFSLIGFGFNFCLHRKNIFTK